MHVCLQELEKKKEAKRRDAEIWKFKTQVTVKNRKNIDGYGKMCGKCEKITENNIHNT